MDARTIIERLALEPHPEGGWFRETWRAEARRGERASGTAIYFLLEQGQASAWHRIDADEIWHYYAGAALELRVHRSPRTQTWQLGPGLESGERPQRRVPAHAWQSARSLGEWSLVGCTVSPAFEFEHFELPGPGGFPPREA